MTDAEWNALPGADPKHPSHAVWCALVLGETLAAEGHDRTRIACAFIAAANQLSRDANQELTFAYLMEGVAVDLAREAALKAIPTDTMPRN